MTSSSLQDIVPNVEPSPDEAVKHAEEYTLHTPEGQPLNFCKAKPTDLGVGGIGIEMYFVFLKQMIILFGVLSLISLPAVIINYLGGYLYAVEKTSPFEASTIANQKGIPKGETDQEVAEKAIEEHKAYMYTTVGIDLFYCVVYMVILFIFECYNRRRIKRSKNLSVGEFSIMIELEQENSMVDKNTLVAQFSKYGNIHECFIPQYYGQTLQRFIDYSNNEKQILIETKKVGAAENQQELANLKTKRKTLAEQIKNSPNDSQETKRTKAFIIFETLLARKNCLNDYEEFKTLKNAKNQPQGLQYKGIPMAVTKAPEPSEIYWENFGVRKSSWKIALINLILLLTFFITLLLISIVEYYENRLPTYSKCLEFNLPGNLTINETLSQPHNDEQVVCFCGGLTETEIESNPDYKEFCEDYWKEFFMIWVIRLSGLGAVALIGMLLKYAIMGAAKLERCATNTVEELSKFMLLFISQSINMTLVIFIANLDLSSISFFTYIQENVPGGKYFFKGLHPNFTRFWYVKVGMAILVLKTINVLWPQILSIVFMVPACAAKRILCAHKEVTQKDMNKCYEKLNINLWDRYASSLSNGFFALVFCSGIPLLLPLQMLYHVVQYWIDKALCIFLYS